MRLDYRHLRPYRDYQSSRQLSLRLGVLQALVALGFLIYLGVFWYFQGVRGNEFALQAEENRLRRQVERPLRGPVRDVRGEVVATNRPSFAVYLDRERTEDPERELRALARFLDEEPDEMLARLVRARKAPAFQPVLLLPDVGLEVAARINAFRPELPAIDVEVVPKRHYPLGGAAAHLLGYLSEASPDQVEARELLPGDLVGQTGVERASDDNLRGRAGVLLEEVNARGRPIRTVSTMLPVRHGESLVVTVDASLQRVLEEAYAGRGGAAVFIDPATGAIRALYSGPSFDPNLFSGRLSPDAWQALRDDEARPLQNRALGSLYSPGSTYKIVMAAALLEERALAPDETVFCGGVRSFYGRPRHCHFRGGHGWVGIEEAITRSCNIFFYVAGQKLGIEAIEKWSRRFGLGETSGVPLAGEAGGLVPSDEWKRRTRGEPWYPGETISVAIGQGPLLVTPLQMAVVAAAIGNGGFRVHPHLVVGEDVELPEPIGLHADTLGRIRKGLVDVVESNFGTARRARVEGIEVAGKTGTAQVVALDAEEDPGDHAWFVGYAPADAPELAFAVIVEHAGSGGAEAAPVAQKVIEAWMQRRVGPPKPDQLAAAAPAFSESEAGDEAGGARGAGEVP